MRRAGHTLLLVLAGVLLPLGVVAQWSHRTLYNSATFSDRAVGILDSSAVRQVLAQRLTKELVLSGNQQAISFRPGLEVVIDAVVDTQAFRSVFRTALRRTHAAVLSQHNGAGGLNLADSASLIASTSQLPGSATAGNGTSGGLGSSVSDVTERLGALGFWRLDNTISSIALGSLLGALAAAAGALALSRDRRATVRRIGWALVVDGAVIVLALAAAQWWAKGAVHDPALAAAVSGAIYHATADLRDAGVWIAGYGLIVVAAAGAGTRLTPALAVRRATAWLDRRRATSAGTIGLAALALAAGVVLMQDPSGAVRVLVIAAGLWLSYLGVTELLRLVRSIPASRPTRTARWSRVALAGGTVAALAGLVTAALVVTSGGAARRADAAGQLTCNGKASLCPLRLDQAMFPGTHNSMSSSLYPGYLFGEQIDTIRGQLESGVRALLIDTHYGVPSSLQLPGSSAPLVLTDRASELREPPGETFDRTLAERAARLAARAPRTVDAARGIYLCHNYCELGATPFAGALADIKSFLDSNPDQVVLTIIQDATTPDDTSAAIEAAGLGSRLATLTPGQPLPTLGQLISTRHTLVVFAEQGGAGGPAWYHQAYQWFQETPYSFKSPADFTCRPNRGTATAPLLLVNHWITASPPDPAVAATVNSRAALERRIQTCIAQRAVLPNVVAVDFSEQGSLVSTLQAINRAKVKEVTRDRRRRARPAGNAQPAPAGSPAPTAPWPTVTAAPSPTVAKATTITTLTGGDPLALCAALPSTVRVIVAWAEAALGDGPGEAGITDLVYGPLLARDVGAFVDAAPIELAERARPILARARAAVAQLHLLGLNDTTVGQLADQTSAKLDAPGQPDGVTVRDELTATLAATVPAERLSNAAVVFTAGQPDPATTLDLGAVSQTVAQSAGLSCPGAVASL